MSNTNLDGEIAETYEHIIALLRLIDDAEAEAGELLVDKGYIIRAGGQLRDEYDGALPCWTDVDPEEVFSDD